MTTSGVVEVVITAPDAQWLAGFAHDLLGRRLCAGSHTVERVRSIYRWHGEVNDVTEVRIAIHTRSEHVAAIITLANEAHPYEVPCVVAWPIEQGNPAYLDWVLSETAIPSAECVSSNLDTQIAEIASELGWSRLRTADDFVNAWRSFVSECCDGYSMNIYEFENDRSVRGRIERLFTDGRVVSDPGYSDFRQSIDAEDQRYRALLQAGVDVGGPGVPWWERGVLLYAEAELAADLAAQYGVEVGIR